MKILILLLLCFLNASAFAQGRGGRTPGWSVGVLAGASHSEYRGVGYRPLVVPAIRGRFGAFSFEGAGASVDLLAVGPFSMEFTLGFFGGGYNPDRSSYLTGMSERHSSAHGGVKTSLRIGRGFSLSLGGSHDLLGRSQGLETEVGLNKMFFFGPKFKIITGVGLNRWDRNLVDYYYGVGPLEALVDRPAFVGSASVFPSARLIVNLSVTEKWQSFLILSRQWLGREMRNSPLTSRSGSEFLGLGLSYKF